MELRFASFEDIPVIKTLADEHRHSLGFVNTGMLRDSIQNKTLILAFDAVVVGFIRFHHRRDKVTTIYDVCVDGSTRRRGVGRLLMQSVIDNARNRGNKEISLKSPVDLDANAFYGALGFTLIGVEEGRKRLLNLWSLRI